MRDGEIEMNVAYFLTIQLRAIRQRPKHGLLFSFFGPDSNANQYVIDSFFFRPLEKSV